MILTPTKEQKKVIECDESLVVIAKPGSGKTYILSQKIRKILPSLPDYRGVIAISYTNKASDELKNRSTRNAINPKSSFFGTIDRFCTSEIIIPFLSHFWGKPNSEIQIIKRSELRSVEQNDIKDIKNTTFSLLDIIKCEQVFKKQFINGKILIESTGALALYTLENSLACQKYLTARYTHVIIDEYQDSGQEQHDLFLKLKNIGLIALAVGDADQSIFGFSNKDSKYLLSLPKQLDFKHFVINNNHRCHPSIINYSLKLLNNDVDLLESQHIRVYEKCCVGSQESIAHWIDKIISKVMEGFKLTKYKDIGILVKNNLSGQIIDNTLNANHRFFISHPLEEHFSLWARLFCLLLYYKFNQSLTAQEIIDECLTSLNLGDKKLLRNKIKNVRQTDLNIIGELFIDIASIIFPNAKSDDAITILNESLKSNIASYFQPAQDSEIQVMTLHKAKGLEFEVVFHLDLYEWVFPAKRPGKNGDFDNPEFISYEQDINLHYVGITRAKKACILCTSTKRLAQQYNSNDIVERNGKYSEFFNINDLGNLRKKLSI